MGNSHGSGIARPRRLGSANAVAAAALGEEEKEKEKENEKEEEEEEEQGSYEAACSANPELQTFDAALRRRANRAISAVASGVEVRSLSLGSLRDVTGCLLDMNQEMVRVVLASKRDVWRSPDLFDLVEGYFEGSLHTLDFLAALDTALATPSSRSTSRSSASASATPAAMSRIPAPQNRWTGTRSRSSSCGGSRRRASRSPPSSSPRSRPCTGSK